MSNSHSNSDIEKEKYYAAFQMFDKDGMGRVSASNLGSMMKSLGKNPTSDELQGIHACTKIFTILNTLVQWYFIQYKLYTALTCLHKHVLIYFLDMINDADLDGNKMLDFDEFLGMMNKKVIFKN